MRDIDPQREHDEEVARETQAGMDYVKALEDGEYDAEEQTELDE